ncbi:MAG TPA: VOC family protein [Bryobacteraceae bacterium]|nr:VOC family protein [Bryobacteraceae bacterium]
MTRSARTRISEQNISRREALTFAAAFGAGTWSARASAQATAPTLLPLQAVGLEHLGMTVPDPKAVAEFYGRIFDPQLFQEKDPPPRYYVRLGTAYIAIGGAGDPRSGGNPNQAPSIDHFDVLVRDYKAQEIRSALIQAGATQEAGRFGLPMDPDGIRLQVSGAPGGLTRTVIPSTRISSDDAAIQAVDLDHIVLTVADLERSSAYYSKVFGLPVLRAKKPDRIWFGVGRTRLALEPVGAASKPAIARVCVKIAGFDRHATLEKLKKLGVEVMPLNYERLVRFGDPNGFIFELSA